MTDPKLLDRIRKLLAMAADTSSPEEAAIAARRAAHLMEDHHLSQAEVMPREGIADLIGKSSAGYAARRLPKWYEMMAVPVARLFDCTVRCFVRTDGQQQTVEVLEFTGLDDDAQVASWTLDYLAGQIQQLTQVYRAGHRDASRQSVNDFRMGAAWSIQRMLEQELERKEGRAAANTSGTALMVRRRALVEEFCQIKYQPLYYEQRASDAYHAGCDAGQDVLLSQGVGGSQTARLA